MKNTTLLAAMAATLLPLLAPAPAAADAHCETFKGEIQICVDPVTRSYELINLRQPRTRYVRGRCRGTVRWGADLPFPVANSMHQAVCGKGSYLELK